MVEPVKSITIGNKRIGAGAPVYIVAELSGNHHGSLQRASELVHAAHEAGADAVKLQTYRADTITLDCDAPDFRISGGTSWDGTTLYKLYEKGATPWEWTLPLKELAEKLGMHLFSSPFDRTAVDFLQQVGVQAYKVASFELVDIPLIRYIAKTGKPIIMSTGMATVGEIAEAVDTARSEGVHDIVLLKCTSAYPSDPKDANVVTMTILGATFGVTVGLSDHSPGFGAAAASAALGASMIEKHLTLSRAEGGPESGFALEPHEYSQLVQTVRQAQMAVGKVHFGPAEGDASSMQFRRSLYVAKDIAQGEMFTSENVRSVRPSGGLHPRHYDSVVGKFASMNLKKGTPLDWNHIGGKAAAK